MPGTAVTCLNQHPVKGASYRPHHQLLGGLGGEWFPTGRIVRDLGRKDLRRMIEDMDEDRHLAYCDKCRAATEYRRRE